MLSRALSLFKQRYHTKMKPNVISIIGTTGVGKSQVRKKKIQESEKVEYIQRWLQQLLTPSV